MGFKPAKKRRTPIELAWLDRFNAKNVFVRVHASIELANNLELIGFSADEATELCL